MSNYSTFRDSYKTKEEETSPLVFDIKDPENFEDIVSNFPIVVVDVWSNKCRPCLMLSPKYNELAQKYEEAFHQQKIIFLKDNIEQNENIHKPLVMVVPTFFVYIRGQKHVVEKFSDIDIIVKDLLEKM